MQASSEMDPPQQRPPRLQAILRTVISFTFRSQGIHGSETRHSRGAMPCRTGRKTRRRDPIGCHWRMVLLGRRVIACVVANRAMNRLTAYVVGDRAYAYSELFLPSAWKSCCGVSLGRERDWMASGGKVRWEIRCFDMRWTSMKYHKRAGWFRGRWNDIEWAEMGLAQTRQSMKKDCPGKWHETTNHEEVKWHEVSCMHRPSCSYSRCNEMQWDPGFLRFLSGEWDDMRWCWNETTRWNWHEATVNKMRWDENGWDEMSWKKAEKTWDEMRWDGMTQTAVTAGCKEQFPGERAMQWDQMKW